MPSFGPVITLLQKCFISRTTSNRDFRYKSALNTFHQRSSRMLSAKFISLICLLMCIEAMRSRGADAQNARPGRRPQGQRPLRQRPDRQRPRPVRTTGFSSNTSHCADGEFTCNDGTCMNQTLFCDLRRDCADGSDEMYCKVRTLYCYPWDTGCPGENSTCSEGYFQCGNGKCISFSQACDRRDDCGDRSDEQRSVPGMKCIYGSGADVCVLPQRYVRDNVTHCADEGDSCYGANGEFRCFQCFDGRLTIANTQVCDGVFDCRDLSDECLCDSGAPDLCGNVCRRNESCRLGTLTCGYNNDVTTPVTSVCNRRLDCPDGADERYCRSLASANVTTCPGNLRNLSTLTAFVCDGRPECYDLSDECGAGCEVEQPFCALASRFVASNRLEVACRTAEGRAAGVSRNQICDGLWSACVPRIVEEETDCAARFYCQSGDYISIDKALVCNGYVDCDDGSDERNCTDRFYCSANGSTPISVRRNFMFDDFFDCQDGSDECPPDFLAGNSFSSRNEMISNLFLKVWLWIMAFAAVAGNAFVLTKTAMSFKKLQTASSVSKANHFLIFNLAVADSLMGIYLAILAGYSIRFSGSYCFEDERWRTGTTCQYIGALSVVSSEASVFMLAVLTGIRLYTVLRPLESRDMKLPAVIVAVLLAWGVAVTLAVVPISSLLSDRVTDSAWVPSKFFSTTRLSHRAATNFSDEISIFSPRARPITTQQGEILPWQRISGYLDAHSSGATIRGLFGYYSLNSVCVSKLFVTPNQPGWQFSIAIVSINFVLFLFVAIAYAVIYKVSTANRRVQTSNDRSAKMQRKIIKLVATEFACWVPICIMVYLHFSQTVRLDNSMAYVATAVVLLPINSVLNPLLYSNSFEFLWGKAKACWMRTGRRYHCRMKGVSEDTEMSETRKGVASALQAHDLTRTTPLQTPELSRKT